MWQSFNSFACNSWISTCWHFPLNKNNINQDKLKITQNFNPPTKAAIPSTPAIIITQVTSSAPTTLYNQFQEALNQAKSEI